MTKKEASPFNKPRTARVQEQIDAVDRGWRQFWLNRGFKTPPRVSKSAVGSFDLPTRKTHGHKSVR